MKYVKLFESWINEAEMSAEQLYKKQLDAASAMKTKLIKLTGIEGAAFGQKLNKKIGDLRNTVVSAAYKGNYDSIKNEISKLSNEIDGNTQWRKYYMAVDREGSIGKDTSSDENFRYDVMMDGDDKVVDAVAKCIVQYELAIILLYNAQKNAPQIKKIETSKLEPGVLVDKISKEHRGYTETKYSVGMNASVLSSPGYSYFDKYDVKKEFTPAIKKSIDKVTYDDLAVIVGLCTFEAQSAAATMASAVNAIAKKDDNPTVMNRIAGAIQDLDSFMSDLRVKHM